MKILINSSTADDLNLAQKYNIDPKNVIQVTMYMHPIIYDDSEIILGSVVKNGKDRSYHTTVNPYRIINGPLSEYGEELEPPIQQEYDSFVEDCVTLVKEMGFTVIKRYRSTDSHKSEYVIVFGIDDTPYGCVVYDLRISDHPFDATFPEDLKDEVVEYLKMDKILDESATKAGINFQVEKVTVGSVKHDTWDRAFNRLFIQLKRMRNAVKRLLKLKD